MLDYLKKPGRLERETVTLMRGFFANEVIPYNAGNCKIAMEALPEMAREKFLKYGEKDFTPGEQNELDVALGAAKKTCMDEAESCDRHGSCHGEFKNGMAIDEVYIHEIPSLTVAMSKGLPDVFLTMPELAFSNRGKLLFADTISEIGSPKHDRAISADHYLRDWGGKLKSIIDKNQHLFMDDYYWDTEGDRQVVEQIKGGQDFFTIEVDQGNIEWKRAFIESLPRDTIFTVIDNRVIVNDKERKLVSKLVNDRLRRNIADIESIQMEHDIDKHDIFSGLDIPGDVFNDLNEIKEETGLLKDLQRRYDLIEDVVDVKNDGNM